MYPFDYSRGCVPHSTILLVISCPNDSHDRLSDNFLVSASKAKVTVSYTAYVVEHPVNIHLGTQKIWILRTMPMWNKLHTSSF